VRTAASASSRLGITGADLCRATLRLGTGKVAVDKSNSFQNQFAARADGRDENLKWMDVTAFQARDSFDAGHEAVLRASRFSTAAETSVSGIEATSRVP